jgi:hypothetical protein
VQFEFRQGWRGLSHRHPGCLWDRCGLRPTCEALRPYAGCDWSGAQIQPRRVLRHLQAPGYVKPLKAFVSTSYVEKHNQTMRQQMKRFARLTAGHSKKIDNHVHMVALYTCWYISPVSAAAFAFRLLWPLALQTGSGTLATS